MNCRWNFGIAVAAAILGIFLQASASAASWNPMTDLRFGLNGRTYPIGAQIVANGGVSQLLWGDEQEKSADGTLNWKYGYVRLAANVATSFVVNRVGAEFQFFPVSIFGLSLGYDAGVRNFTPKTVDCQGIACNGSLYRKYLRMQFLGAYSGVSLFVQGRYEDITGSDKSRPFFDEMTLVVGRSDGEKVLTWQPVLLYKLQPSWQVGAAMLYSHAIDTGGYSLLYGPVVSHQPTPEVTILLGVGPNRSPVVHSALAGFFTVQWMFKGGLPILDRIVSEAQAQASRN